MRMHRGVLSSAFLSPETISQDDAAAGRICRRHPHPKRLYAVCERRRELVVAIDQLQCRDLAIGKTSVCRGVCRIGIDIVWATLRGPGIAIRIALAHVEDRAAGHVVVHDAVDKSVK